MESRLFCPLFESLLRLHHKKTQHDFLNGRDTQRLGCNVVFNIPNHVHHLGINLVRNVKDVGKKCHLTQPKQDSTLLMIDAKAVQQLHSAEWSL